MGPSCILQHLCILINISWMPRVLEGPSRPSNFSSQSKPMSPAILVASVSTFHSVPRHKAAPDLLRPSSEYKAFKDPIGGTILPNTKATTECRWTRALSQDGLLWKERCLQQQQKLTPKEPTSLHVAVHLLLSATWQSVWTVWSGTFGMFLKFHLFLSTTEVVL